MTREPLRSAHSLEFEVYPVLSDWRAETFPRVSSPVLTQNSSTDIVTIAVVDDAIDTRHTEFAGRIVGEWDAASGGPSSRPISWQPHGTKVAGLALAAGVSVSGVAPKARLLAVRVPALTQRNGDATEAAGIAWAAENGADVICCAWGPPNPTAETGRLPEHTRDAIDWATAHGRGGKGCVVVFSSGNDGNDIALNEYASHPGVIAVGACNCHGKHPHYSGWGDALWCVVPSNDPLDPIGAYDTYDTTTPIGSFLLGDTFYTSDFGFTSAACAVAAGVCAQILSVNPSLTSRGVRDVIAQSCRKIDTDSGSYDERGHSPYYGYGCVDLTRALEIAQQNFATSSV
jgi:subtilisin family serine protease